MKFEASRLYQFLFLICVSVVFINVYELTFAVWILAALFTISTKYSITILQYVLCFATILGIAFVSSFLQKETSYNLFRDISYLLKPIIGLVLGYQLYKKCQNKFFKTIIYTGVIVALGHLVIIFITLLRFHTVSINLLREYGGYHSDFEIYALVLLIFYRRFEVTISKGRVQFLILILTLSSFCYLSRTNIIQLIILCCAIKGFFVINRKSLLLTFTAICLVVLGYTAIYQSNPHRAGKGLEAFLYKIKIAPIEAFKTKVNVDDWKDFNDNYRSFENILVVKQVGNSGTRNVIMGKGLGSRINLGREIYTNDGEFIQYIPILHNGYATAFLKAGILGVICIIIFIYLVGKHKNYDVPAIRNINFLFVGTCLFLIVSNWVFMGLYLKLDNKSILIGFMVAYREYLIRKEHQKPTPLALPNE